METMIELKNIPVSYSKEFNYPIWEGEYPKCKEVEAKQEWLEEVVVDDPSITMRFSYPLSRDVFFDFDAPEDGFTRRELIDAIRLGYHHIYDSKSSEVCCHGIGDLVIDSIVCECGIQYHPIILL